MSGAVADRGAVARARLLRAVCAALEGGLWLVVGATAAAFGAVHEWAYVPLWFAAAALGLVLAARGAIARRLRGLLGRDRFAFHATGRWLSLGRERSPYGGDTGWSFDLARPLLPATPLLLPGLVFLAWTLIQLVPLPPALLWRPPELMPPPGQWGSLSVSPADTLRGLTFVAALLLLHLAAAAVFESRGARVRFRAFLAALGFALAVVGLAQRAAGTPLIYGFFQPLELLRGDARFFGPFVNRNHFATYMVMVAPISLGLVALAWRRYGRRVGSGSNLRRRLVSLQSAQGTTLLYAIIPAMATVGALIATTSRGGITAFLAAAALALCVARARAGLAALAPLALFALALSWFGVERLGVRFEDSLRDSVSRTTAWRDALSRMDGYWLAGSGLNTWAAAMSRTSAWSLPAGATPWVPPHELESATTPRMGFYVPEGTSGWFREAHNDYLQMLVEGGLPGLAILLWALAAVLRRRGGDPWLLAALLGPMLHSLVDFGPQVPAISVLFVTLAALPASPVEPRPGKRELPLAA